MNINIIVIFQIFIFSPLWKRHEEKNYSKNFFSPSESDMKKNNLFKKIIFLLVILSFDKEKNYFFWSEKKIPTCKEKNIFFPSKKYLSPRLGWKSKYKNLFFWSYRWKANQLLTSQQGGNLVDIFFWKIYSYSLADKYRPWACHKGGSQHGGIIYDPDCTKAIWYSCTLWLLEK